ncbi:MAG: hypothetical protein KY397_07180 [Gemmatimonadetes bacterium]|nr:hypothetical protein [Gemmatimonadota bacterium]
MERFFDRFVSGTAAMPPPEALLANLPAPPAPRESGGAAGALAAFLQTALYRVAD